MTLYALKYRPVSFCTIPRGLRWEYVYAPAGELTGFLADFPKHPKYPYGVFKADRALTVDERLRQIFEEVA